jgi:putative transposase
MGDTPERFPFANGLFHITNRGVDRRDIVRDDQDRDCWFRLLDRVASRLGWRVFAYALLNNHFHLYLRTPRDNLSEGMRDFEGGYVTNFNLRYNREGHLFQGRFHAVVVENEAHSWELTRYIHLNSLRAGIVTDPFHDLWSSYRHYLNSKRAPAWLDWKTVLAELGRSEAAARLAYKRFIDAGITNPPTSPLADAVDGWILGSEEFVDQCRAWRDGIGSRLLTVDVQQILESVAEVFGTKASDIISSGRHRNRARDSAILLSRQLSGESLEVLASHFGGVTRSAITEAVRRARERASREPAFAAMVNHIRKRVCPEASDVQNSKLAAGSFSDRSRFSRQF